MRSKFVALLMGCALTVSFLTGCGNGEADEASTPDAGGSAEDTGTGADGDESGDGAASAASDLKIAIVCDESGQNDNGYNQSAVEGAKECADTMGAEYKVVEPTESIGNTLSILAEDGFNLIFSMAYDFDALVNGEAGAAPIAEQYPDTVFVVFNATPNVDEAGAAIHNNVISVLYNVNESSYLAGALSVLVNENADVLLGDGYDLTSPEEARALGFIGATDSDGITVFGVGFVEGAQHVAEELGVTYDYYSKYDAGFADTAGGSNVAGTYYGNGANVVYTVAGSVGDGVASKAKEVKKLAVHVDANKDAQQPGYILTSVTKNTKVVVKTLAEAYVGGTIMDMDKIQVYDLASGATSITDLAAFSAALETTDEAKAKWDEILAYVADLEAKIGDGTIKVTNKQNGDSFDEASCPNINFK